MAGPEGYLYLWDWFCELDAARAGNGFGSNPITFVDLEAWSRLTGRRFRPWEVDVIRSLDMAVMTMRAKRAEKDRQQSGKPSGEIMMDDLEGFQRVFGV